MKISDEKSAALYSAIADPITDQRIMLAKHGVPNAELMEQLLFNMQNEIWRKVHKALNLDCPL